MRGLAAGKHITSLGLAREVHAKQYEVETCNTRHSMCANICGSIYHVDFRVYVRQIDI